MGFFSKAFKVWKKVGKDVYIKPGQEAWKGVGKAIGSFMGSMAPDAPADTSAADAERLAAETEEDRKRRLAAMQDLQRTGSLGAGSAATVARPKLTTGVM